MVNTSNNAREQQLTNYADWERTLKQTAGWLLEGIVETSPEPTPPWRMLGSLRLGQCLINALIDNGNLQQVGGDPHKTEDGKIEVAMTAYRVIGRDPFYMEDHELIGVMRSYIVKLERQNAERKAHQKREEQWLLRNGYLSPLDLHQLQ